MNIKKFSKRLNKINLLFQSIKEDGHISSIEKDLLLNYLRDAYEYAKEDSSSTENRKPEKVYREPEVHVPPLKETAETPNKEVITQIIQEEITQTDKTAIEVDKPNVPSHEVEVDVSDKLKKIFENEAVNELSDRLSMSPIADMTKAMGINERIFTVKELFGGDNEIFNSILQRLNAFTSYDDARTYLITGIAKDQEWGDPSKIKKADTFVKLVKRRYI